MLNRVQNVEAEKANQKKLSHASTTQSNQPVMKTSKREGSQQGHDITGMQETKQTWSPPTQATKHSRRTTSLLNLFMSNPHGM